MSCAKFANCPNCAKFVTFVKCDANAAIAVIVGLLSECSRGSRQSLLPGSGEGCGRFVTGDPCLTTRRYGLQPARLRRILCAAFILGGPESLIHQSRKRVSSEVRSRCS